MRRVGRVADASGGLSAAALRSAAGPTIARQPDRAAASGEAELWCEPLIPAEEDDDSDDARSRRRGDEPERWWGAELLHRFSPVDILLAGSVVVLLAAMVVVAIALTNHV